MAALSFGERIRAKRLALLANDPRFTLRQLAARLGIQPSYLSRLERGAIPSLSEEHLQALARELNDDPDILCVLTGKLPGDVRRILLNAPQRLLPLVRALEQPDWLGPDARNTPPQFWDCYRESQHLARVGSFVRDLQTGEDFWSEEFFRIFGLPAGSPAPDFAAFMELVHPDDRQAVMSVRHRMAAGGEPIHYAYRFKRGDGLWRQAKAVARCQYDADGRARRILGTVQDVTTERQALEDLRAVAQFPEDNPNPVLRVGRDGRLAFANRASSPLLDAAGLAVGEPVGSPILDAVQAALTSATSQEIDMAVGAGVQRLTVVPLPASGQANIYGRDVSDLHHAADSLAAAEARCQRIINDAVLGIFRATQDGRLLSANPALARLFGYASAEEMLAQAGGDTNTLYQDPQRRREVVHRLANKEGLLNFENPYRRKDGSMFIGNLHARLSVEADGERVIEGFIEDITERQQVQAELAASEERLQTHLRNFPLPTFTFALSDRQFVLANANKAAEALSRGRIGGCLGSPAETIFEASPDVYLALWSAFEGRCTGRRRLSLRVPGAEDAGLFDMTFVFVAPDTVMLHAEEITALARMRDDLHRTAETLRTILEHVPYATLLAAADGRTLYVNQRFTDLVGYTLDDIPSVVEWMPKAYPDPNLRARVAADWQSIQGRPCHRIYPVRCGDGRSRWIDFNTVALPDGRMLLTLNEADPRPLLGTSRADHSQP
ncbi:PAS domain S-box protein [Desulfovibrio aerotolerans]|uniref:histidine kinase n=1 Tax=Solidesulfovibrio aerotolerans TaxID=295255 RepID=A0A7C9IY01_9BACT|nr:PAS domain S-box protein [Solidesulfovibrio aerotolerans]MYL84562.1 PAS domain S-box protein [Solidesulfovibrio aerotolerans]